MRAPDRMAVACALLLAADAVALAAYLAAPAPQQDRTAPFPEPSDRPLLESPQQVRESRETGRCAFWVGDDYYVVEGLPEGYVDYSEAWQGPA